MTRTETGEYEQCSQYVVDWNLVLNGSKPQNQEVGDLDWPGVTLLSNISGGTKAVVNKIDGEGRGGVLNISCRMLSLALCLNQL